MVSDSERGKGSKLFEEIEEGKLVAESTKVCSGRRNECRCWMDEEQKLYRVFEFEVKD